MSTRSALAGLGTTAILVATLGSPPVQDGARDASESELVDRAQTEMFQTADDDVVVHGAQSRWRHGRRERRRADTPLTAPG